MEPNIISLSEKKLVGMNVLTSLTHNKTTELWQSFMPRHKEIVNTANELFISMQVYEPHYSFTNFNPSATFQKWATREVNNWNTLPDGMHSFVLPAGLYAAFHYKGLSSDPGIFHYIFGTWLPASGYTLDNRPHFEELGANYKNNDPESEETIYIPVKPK